jgi:hypothetical protein
VFDVATSRSGSGLATDEEEQVATGNHGGHAVLLPEPGWQHRRVARRRGLLSTTRWMRFTTTPTASC